MCCHFGLGRQQAKLTDGRERRVGRGSGRRITSIGYSLVLGIWDIGFLSTRFGRVWWLV